MAASSMLQQVPTELYVSIMEQCDSPFQIKSLISADPVALSCYMQHRVRILRSVEANLCAYLDQLGLVQAGLLTTRLCHLRQNSALYDDEEAYQQRFEFLTDQRDDETENQRLKSLRFLCVLSDLISNTDEIISDYIPAAWASRIKKIAKTASKERVEILQQTQPPSPSREESCQLYRTVFGFEIHSCWHARGDVRLKYILPSRLVKTVLSDRSIDFWHIAKEYGILSYIYDRHDKIFQRVANTNEDLVKSAGAPQEGPDLYESMAHDPSFPDSLAGRHLLRLRLHQRTDLEEYFYISWLCNRGLSLLKSLPEMSPEEQDTFILASFFRIAQIIKIRGID